MLINVSDQFTDPFADGTPRRYHYTGPNIPPIDPLFRKEEVGSLRTTILHELGHALGFLHWFNEDKSHFCDLSVGIMAPGAPMMIPPVGLSDDDRCRFALLYCSTVVPVEEVAEQDYTSTVAPNLTEELARFSFALDTQAYVEITVYDVLGSRVATLFQGVLQHGEHTRNFSVGDLTAGFYTYALSIDGEVTTGDLIVIK